jgi:OTU domain-containing protein 6
MGAKKNKVKKMLAPSTQPNPDISIDDDLADDIFAVLDSRDQTVQQPQQEPTAAYAQTAATSDKSSSKSRFKARQVRLSHHDRSGLVTKAYPKARKVAALAELQPPTDAAADAKLEREAKDEERAINRICNELGLDMHEVRPQPTNALRCTYSTHEMQITPDGHCLFSAVADQLALLNLLPSHEAHYLNTRYAAAGYMLAHPEDFAPFLPRLEGEDGRGASESGIIGPREYARYCATIRDTGAWGGEPEILALSRAYAVTIHVVQGGQPPVVVHDPSGKPRTDNLKDQRAVRISYHRRMYGLGEVRTTPRNFLEGHSDEEPDCSTITRCDREQGSTRSPALSKTFWPPHDGS